MGEPKLVLARFVGLWAFYSFWRDGKIHSLPPCRCGKKKALEAVGHPSGNVAFVDEMGEPKLILARIGGECKTRKSSKSAQNSILLFQEAPPCHCEEKEVLRDEKNGQGRQNCKGYGGVFSFEGVPLVIVAGFLARFVGLRICWFLKSWKEFSHDWLGALFSSILSKRRQYHQKVQLPSRYSPAGTTMRSKPELKKLTEPRQTTPFSKTTLPDTSKRSH